MKKHGFTLAEVLITLLILGVIAALTIPTLVQNTHRKEEQVKLKKALSVLQQAVQINYAMTQKDLSQMTKTEFIQMLKNRMVVTASVGDAIQTQDGLTYYINNSHAPNCGVGDSSILVNSEEGNVCFTIFVSTIDNAITIAPSIVDIIGNNYDRLDKPSGTGGFYHFFATATMIFPGSSAAKFMYAKDPTNIGGS